MAKSRKSGSESENSGPKVDADVVDAEIVDEVEAEQTPSDDLSVEDAPAEPSALELSEDQRTDTEQDVEAIEDLEDEVASEPQPEITPEPVPEAVPEPAARRGGFFGLVFGGLLAAAIGYGLAWFVPQGWPIEFGANTEALEAEVAELQTQVTDLESQLADLGSQLTEAGEDRAELKGSSDANASAIAQITERFDAQPAPEPFDTAEIDADLRAVLQAQKAEISSLQSDLGEMAEFAKSQIANAEAEQRSAEEAELRVIARGALNSVRDAMSSGEPFADQLPAIAPTAEIPAALEAVASDGVPTQQAVQNDFPQAARTALSASLRETAGDTTQSRLKLFLQDQIGARSLTPRDGDDPDAVLSRAEAAVKTGDLSAALELVEALPENGKAALMDWSAQAQSRLDALEALGSLENALSAN